ncbi:MAG: alpha/beta hydrolase [Acidobacteriia bacterium]|nr:alpha/beta hydrolase [Terriglobia bacterium]MYG03644.1 alpha/beta hydrolase [Terriglobia bacterium]MYK08864.1 alpha/beta hydrolase [Terriglobia bacterium]
MRLRLLLLFVAGVSCLHARVEENVAYAMRGGLAMLLDVHYPERSNGFGIVFIAGSGWHAPLTYDAAPLKASGFAKLYVPPLTEAGFTVFVINHRAAPRYSYPAPIEDAQRAVRFVRHNADRFGIDPIRIGGVGGSSGGHLISMLGVLDGGGEPASPDPVERVSAKLQAVFARAAPFDLTLVQGRFSSGSVSSLLGMRLGARDAPSTKEHRTYWAASPAAHVSPDDPPFLLMHGTADDRVPHGQSEEFLARLETIGIEAELVLIEGGGHGASFPGATNPPDFLGAMVSFFQRQLSNQAEKDASPPKPLRHDPSIERDVPFGMVSGGALLMDVYRPDRPNGIGILHITGSGWHSPLAANAPQQKASRQVEVFGRPLVEAGYTVFAVNHRTAPLNKYPAQLEDVERAVRFVRFHAARWDIDPERIGGIGGSSGGHLTLMLGVFSAIGDPEDPDPVNRENARLQAIVPWAPPTDLVMLNGEYGQGTFGSLFGMRLLERDPKSSPQFKAYRDASPIHHVSPGDPPTLLIHGDADGVVPLRHSEIIAARMRAADIAVEMLVIPGGGHGALFPGKIPDAPDYVQAAVDWFDRHLRD